MRTESRKDRLPRDPAQREHDTSVLRVQQEIARSLSQRVLHEPRQTLSLSSIAIEGGLEEKARYIATKNSALTVGFTEAVTRGVVRTLLSAAAELAGSKQMASHIQDIDLGASVRTVSDFSAIQPVSELDNELVPPLSKLREFARGWTPTELLVAVGGVRTRGNWEFLTPSNGEVERTVNLRFSNRAGSFATPFSIGMVMAKGLVDEMHSGELVDAGHLPIICDPACGSGALLLAAAQAQWEALRRARVNRGGAGSIESVRRKELVQRALYGADVSQDQARLCRITLGVWGDLGPSDIGNLPIVVGDSLRDVHTPRQLTLGEGNEYSLEYDDSSSSPVDWGQTVSHALGVGVFEGFDGVIMNPPYGRLKTHTTDYTNGENRTSLSPQERQLLHQREKEHLNHLVQGFRGSPGFVHSTLGELDWYRLFLDRATSLVNGHGVISAIVPASFLSDRNSSILRREYLQHSSIRKLVHFVETANLFPTVGQPTCILLARRGEETREVEIVPRCRNVIDATAQGTFVHVDAIEQLGPTLPIPALERVGWGVLDKLRALPRIGEIPAVVNLRGELELTMHKRFIRSSGKFAPLVRGDSVERFRLRSSDEVRKPSLVDIDAFLTSLGSSEKKAHHRVARLAGRQCAYLEKKRRLSFATVPKGSVLGNSCNYVMISQRDSLKLPTLLGLLNSTLFEWRLRLTGATNHVNNYEIANLPLPIAASSQQLLRIGDLALQLERTYADHPFGTSKQPWSPMENTLDIEVFDLFGINANEAAHVITQVGDSSARADVIRAELRR